MRPALRRAPAAVALLLALPLAACSHAPAPQPARTTAAAAVDGGGAPVVATPIDTGAPVKYDPAAQKSLRRNEIGEPWTLDAAAATACAHAEFAFRTPETGGSLTAEVSRLRASVRATKSTALRAAVAALPAAPTAVQVRPVLAACTAMGYQL